MPFIKNNGNIIYRNVTIGAVDSLSATYQLFNNTDY